MDTNQDRQTFLKEALSVGLLGAATVALWFLVVNSQPALRSGPRGFSDPRFFSESRRRRTP